MSKTNAAKNDAGEIHPDKITDAIKEPKISDLQKISKQEYPRVNDLRKTKTLMQPKCIWEKSVRHHF